MEYDKIQQLMEDMGKSRLSKVEITFPDGTKIKMKKEERQEERKEKKEMPIQEEKKEEVCQEMGITISSPMVGTFYRKPSQDAKPFVEIGQEVRKGDTLCIIEAMKLMNEIEAEKDGKIVKILVKDGETVEYGTPLFILE